MEFNLCEHDIVKIVTVVTSDSKISEITEVHRDMKKVFRLSVGSRPIMKMEVGAEGDKQSERKKRKEGVKPNSWFNLFVNKMTPNILKPSHW